MKYNPVILIFATAILVCGGCKNRSTSADRPVITVSIEPQRWMLERIVGNRMEVQTLMARGGNPESYEPAFSHLADMERSSCYMVMGNLGFEAAIIDRISSSLPDMPIVNTSDSITLIIDEHGHNHGIDPHVWSSAANARIIARNMLRAVIDLDPEGRDVYVGNYKRLNQTINYVDSVCTTILKPHAGTNFMVWHPSLSYFARDYNLNQITIGAEGKEHSILDTRDVLKRVKDDGVSVFLVQQDFDTSKSANLVNGDNNIRIATINPLNYDWDTELLHTAYAIAGH